MKAVPLDPLAVAIGATADETEYVAELGALTLQGVRRKTPQLEALKEGARKQLKELASVSSGSFVESADCVHRVRDELARVKRHLEALESHLPLSAVQADAQRCIDERRRNVALLAKHADVLEVLEQPMLMDTCVRNGFIDEALELEAAVRSRALVHANVPIAVRVAVEVSAHMGELRDVLLTQLAGPLQLPDAMRVVGYLRRMGAHAMSEADLRAVFVRNRTIFFTQAEATLPRDSPATFLLKYIDLCRVHWYDTVTHYRAVFAADDEAAATTPAAPMPNPPCENAPPAGVSATQLGNLLLGKWAIERIDEFVLTCARALSSPISSNSAPIRRARSLASAWMCRRSRAVPLVMLCWSFSTTGSLPLRSIGSMPYACTSGTFRTRPLPPSHPSRHQARARPELQMPMRQPLAAVSAAAQIAQPPARRRRWRYCSIHRWLCFSTTFSSSSTRCDRARRMSCALPSSIRSRRRCETACARSPMRVRLPSPWAQALASISARYARAWPST